MVWQPVLSRTINFVVSGNVTLQFPQVGLDSSAAIDLRDGMFRNQVLKAVRRAREATQLTEGRFTAIQNALPPPDQRKKITLSNLTIKTSSIEWLDNLTNRKRGGVRLTPLMRKIVTTHFVSPYFPPRLLKRILQVYTQTNAGLQKPIEFQAIDPQELTVMGRGREAQAEGFVDLDDSNPAFQKMVNRFKNDDGTLDEQTRRLLQRTHFRPFKGNVFVRFELLGSRSVDFLARVIVHEATHKFAHTVDIAYARQSEYSKMPDYRAAENADSYAFAAISLLKKQLIKHDDLQREPAAVPEIYPIIGR